MSQPEYDPAPNVERRYAEEVAMIRKLLRQVRRAPHNRRYRLVEHAEYMHTRADMEWIINRLGYRPTRTMWEEAGVKQIDRTFVGRGPDWLDRR